MKVEVQRRTCLPCCVIVKRKSLQCSWEEEHEEYKYLAGPRTELLRLSYEWTPFGDLLHTFILE